MSPYIDPRTVRSPKLYINNLRLMYDGGEGGFSLAELIWDGEPRLGIRWNGDGEGNIGSPQSRGIPTWFILPPEIETVIKSHIMSKTDTDEIRYKKDGTIKEWA